MPCLSENIVRTKIRFKKSEKHSTLTNQGCLFSEDLFSFPCIPVGLPEWVVFLDICSNVRAWKGLFPVQRKHSGVAKADAEKPDL